MVGALLGGAKFEVREPPTLDDIRLPTPRIAIPEPLRAFSSSDRETRASHTYGKSYRDLVRGFAGDFSSAPDMVARPRDEAEIRAVLDWCADNRVACIPFGGGTSVVGGIEGVGLSAYAGVVSLDMRALSNVLEVDETSRCARIQAGATGPDIAAQLTPYGLALRHYPQSFEFSTLGGWIATRAGGHYATLYTHIDDLVQSVRMLTPRGVWQSRQLPGSGAGPSPDRFALGSEGIFGVITEAWMRVQARPVFRTRASVAFRVFEDAVNATREIAQSGLYPTNCRLLDAREAMVHQIGTNGAHVLLLAFESADHPTVPWMDRALDIVRSHSGQVSHRSHSDESNPGTIGDIKGDTQESQGQAGSWRRAFFDMPYRLNALVSLGVIADTFETACTWTDFASLHTAIIAAVRGAMKRTCGRGMITCRFTHVYPDGPAPYYTFLAPGPSRTSEHATPLLDAWTEIKTAASNVLVEHGATITHHHAVGRIHRPWYDQQRPEPFAEVLCAAKERLDPAGVLNPGVLIDPASTILDDSR